jgi:solute carrier family 25 (mitochondrial folate transporter), member 32
MDPHYTSRKNLYVHAGAGCVAGVASAVVSCPLDIVKFRLQNQIKGNYKGIVQSLKFIVKQDGWKGLYRGLTPTVQVYMIDRAIWFPLYHVSKNEFSKWAELPISNPWIHLSACTWSSAVTLLITHPLWLIRTRIMIHGTPLFSYSSLASGITTMIHKEGYRSLYKGVGPSLLGISHVAIQFPLYEKFKLILLKRHDRPQPDSLDVFIASSVSKLIASSLTYPHEVLSV